MSVQSKEIYLSFPKGAYRDEPLAQRSAGLRAVSLIGLLFLFTLVGSLFWFRTFPAWQDANELASQGQIAKAQIESRRVAQDREGNDSYYVTYGFRAAETGSYFTREQRVSRDTYERLESAAPVKVRYLPSNADRSTLADDRTEFTARTVAAGLNAAAAIAVLIGLVVQVEKRNRQNTRVRREPVFLGNRA